MDAELMAALAGSGQDELRYQVSTRSLVFEHGDLGFTLHVTGTDLRRWLHRSLLVATARDAAPVPSTSPPLVVAIRLLHSQLVEWAESGHAPTHELELIIAA